MNFWKNLRRRWFPTKEEESARGYDWALEQYSKGMSLEELSQWYALGNCFDPGSGFDKGISNFTHEQQRWDNEFNNGDHTNPYKSNK